MTLSDPPLVAQQGPGPELQPSCFTLAGGKTWPIAIFVFP